MHFYGHSKAYTFKKIVFITYLVFFLDVSFPVNAAAAHTVSICGFTDR